MKLLSWNVNGIRATLGKGFQESMEALAPDVICLQETKARQEQVCDLWLSSWHGVWNSAQRPGYSGTLILSREAPESVHLGIGVDEHDTEGRVITARFAGFSIVNVYTPNSGEGLKRLGYRQEWDVAFREYVARVSAEGRPLFICGDLNVAHEEIDIARPNDNHFSAGFTDEERAGFRELLAAGFHDSFREANPDLRDAYSWWSYRGGARARNVGWRIDYFLANDQAQARVSSPRIHPEITGSDHCPVSVEFEA